MNKDTQRKRAGESVPPPDERNLDQTHRSQFSKKHRLFESCFLVPIRSVGAGLSSESK